VADARTAEQVRRDIAREREQLALAVGRLRSELGGTLDIRKRVGILVPAAFATAFVLAGGIGATMRYFARRGRER
jgi:lysozyme family protein